MNDAPDDFDELLVRVRAGDETALGQLVDQYQLEVRLAARAMLGNLLRPYVDSVDIAQSVHLVLLEGFRDEKFDIASPEKLIGLAVTVVRRKVARHWRKAKRQQRPGNDRTNDELTELLESTCQREANPADAAQINIAIKDLLAGLEGIDRELIELRLADFTTAEAARELNLDPDVLRVRLGRLRKRLRDGGLLSDWL